MGRKKNNKGLKRRQEIVAKAREEEARIKQEETNDRRFNRYYIGFCGLLAIGTMGIISYLELRKDEKIMDASSVIEIPAKISFEQAQDKIHNIPYVQKYLDQLVEEEAKVTKTWQGFDRVIYDPEYKQFEKDTGEKARISGGYHEDDKNLVSLAMTGRIPGKKPVCYVTYRCLHPKQVYSEDELKSLLDNEAFHAYESWKARLTFKKGNMTKEELKEVITMASDEIKDKSMELLSFDYQYYLIIHERKRNVSKHFRDMCFPGYVKLYQEFQELSKQDSYDGKFAKIILNSCGKMTKVNKK